jgi:hypothetical protein
MKRQPLTTLNNFSTFSLLYLMPLQEQYQYQFTCLFQISESNLSRLHTFPYPSPADATVVPGSIHLAGSRVRNGSSTRCATRLYGLYQALWPTEHAHVTPSHPLAPPGVICELGTPADATVVPGSIHLAGSRVRNVRKDVFTFFSRFLTLTFFDVGILHTDLVPRIFWRSFKFHLISIFSFTFRAPNGF